MSHGNGSAPAGMDVRLDAVTVRRGTATVLRSFSLAVAPGRALGIVGANGAGKTTVLDVLSGLVTPDDGDVVFDGGSVTSWSAHARRRAGVRRTFQESRLYPQMTAAAAARVATGSRLPVGVDAIDAPETTYVAELSTGQRRLLDIAAATTGDARLLMLDEPTAGLDPSERRRLVELLREWRNRTSGTLIVVEHDRAVLEELTDEVIVLRDEQGNGNGLAHAGAITSDTEVETLLDTLSATRLPSASPRPAAPSVWALARFGLREFAAGLLSVLALGVLNRVMKVDLGIPLYVVAPILAAYNLAAPLALWIGARSDRRPIGGRHRTPYILGGATLMAAAAAVAPFVAWQLDADIGVASIALGVGVFAVMGVGMYGSGATYFALLSEAVTAARERAVAVVYSMLMAGILAGVALSAFVLPHYDPRALLSLHAFIALLIVVCTWWAVRGAEPRTASAHITPIKIRTFAASAQVKQFFAFLLGLTFFAFLQQAILEPYGGDVFGLSVRATTFFNAVQIGGVLLGMALAARAIVPRIGRQHTVALGCATGAAALCSIAAAGIDGSHVLLYAGIAALGLGLGLLNVGSLSLMLDMTAGHAAGVAMGLWTVAHAIADGAATAGGGILHGIAAALIGSDAAAYSVVFLIEAIGLLAVLPLLGGIDPENLKLNARTKETTR